MEISLKYDIWQLDKNHGLKSDEDYSSYQRNMKDRVVLIETNMTQTHNSFEDAFAEIEKKGNSYTEYTILPRIYKTS